MSPAGQPEESRYDSGPVPLGDAVPLDDFSPADLPPVVRYDASGAIDEDLFCLTCGYNLRGLRGDPVRCPECGSDNGLGDVMLPAAAIREALRELETEPTRCVACSLLGVTSLALIALAVLNIVPMAVGGLFFASLGACASLLLGLACFRRFAATIEDRRLARWIVWRFHWITLLVFGPAVLAITVLTASSRTQNPSVDGVLAAVASPFALLPVAWLIYLPVRRARERAQRDTAVRVARDILRRQMTKPRRRQ